MQILQEKYSSSSFWYKFNKNGFIQREMNCRSEMNKYICFMHQDLQNETKRSFVAQLVQKLWTIL